mgnify:CR=1 FL=1
MRGDIPSRIRIGGLLHEVRLVSQEELGQDRLADCDDVTPLIRLFSGMKHSKRRQIMLHEIFEGLTNTHFLEIGHEQLSVLATEVLRVLDDNPKLRGWLWPKR